MTVSQCHLTFGDIRNWMCCIFSNETLQEKRKCKVQTITATCTFFKKSINRLVIYAEPETRKY